MRALALGSLLSLLLTSPAPAAPGAPAPRDPVPVQLLALNDLHGNLDPVAGASGRITHRGPEIQAGGLAQAATLLEAARAGQRNTLTVAAGDMIGGSPLISALFHDEPTVEALGELGLTVSSAGNHEFDEGAAELRRVIDGGCHPEDGCAPDAPYQGADFDYLAANVTAKGATEPLFTPYAIRTLPGGQRIGFIGVVTKDAPSAINAAMIRDVEFHDEVPVIARYSRELTRRGVRAQVLLVHEGEAVSGTAGARCDEGGPGARLNGRIKDIAERATSAVDVVVSGHSHLSYECVVKDPRGRARAVTQADSFARSFTDLRFDLDARDDVVRDSVRAVHVPVPVTTAPQPAMAKLVETWRARSQELAARVVGYIAGDLPGRGSTLPETPLGSFLADAQAAATRARGADLALLNSGGMRADLVHRGDGAVTYADAYQVQPFDNPLWVLPLTGAQLTTALRQQFSGENEAVPRYLQLSDELRYSVDLSRSGADRLLAETIRVKGEPITADGVYRVALNDYLANGGNGFPVFAEVTTREGGDTTDLEALVTYLETTTSATAPAPVPAPGRITFVTP